MAYDYEYQKALREKAGGRSRRIQEDIRTALLSRRVTANAVLIERLRKLLPHANLPPSDMNPLPAQEDFWWPLTNRWALAMDEALVAAGLPPSRSDSDPAECMRLLQERMAVA
jgi:hypothetical protein